MKNQEVIGEIAQALDVNPQDLETALNNPEAVVQYSTVDLAQLVYRVSMANNDWDRSKWFTILMGNCMKWSRQQFDVAMAYVQKTLFQGANSTSASASEN